MSDELAMLREILGEEAFGRLLEASKITGNDAVPTLQQTIDTHSTLLVYEQAGWAIQLVRGDETRGYSLE